MIPAIRRWLARRSEPVDVRDLRHAYQRLFATPDGQVVLDHLVSSVFCAVYEGTDPQAALVHEARRGVIGELLFNLEVRDE